jgi:hypothetical protein
MSKRILITGGAGFFGVVCLVWFVLVCRLVRGYEPRQPHLIPVLQHSSAFSMVANCPRERPDHAVTARTRSKPTVFNEFFQESLLHTRMVVSILTPEGHL